MYLKRLEVTGFKSFAKHLELDFVPGITVVVGPNGSGKSNVIDAIRWVLGEQSIKALRGSKMEDVIFLGSSTRPPAGYCEVSMTFDNTDRRLCSDYTEVEIARRVYRSGESDYFLNGQGCRLRDIYELFMDTGIGKDTYSIIGQGRVDEILSYKSEDRRVIFEEAAGIVKYKSRKKESEKKLEGTEQNLSRINDLTLELEGQLQTLTEQAEKAREWKELKEDLKKIEVGLYVRQIEQFHSQWETISEQVDELKEAHSILSANLSKEEAELEQLKYQVDQCERELQDFQDQLLHVSEVLKQAEGKREMCGQQQVYAAEKKEQLLTRIEQLEHDILGLQNEKNQFEVLLQEKKQQLHEVEERLTALQQHPIENHENAQLSQVSEQLQHERNHQVALQSEVRYVGERLAQVEQELAKLHRQEVSLIEQGAMLSGQAKALEEELSAIETKMEECDRVCHDLKAQLKELEHEEGQALRRFQQKEQQLHHVRSELKIIQDLETNHTGYFQGVKEVLQAKKQGSLQGIHGTVSQLLRVAPEYEAAIETALGGAAQYLVVEDEYAGRQAIRYLKEKRLGRSTFLPLTVIKERTLPAGDMRKCQGLPGFVDIGSNLVESDDKYQEIIRSFLGLLIVAKGLDEANQIARAFQYRYKVVTLDGDVINTGGSMSGGSRQKAKAGLIGRSRQLEELKQEALKIEEAYKESALTLQDVKGKKQEIQRKLEQRYTLQETNRLQKQQLQARYKEAELKKEALSDSQNRLQGEYSQCESQKEALFIRQREAEDQLQECEQSIQQLTQQLEDLQADMRDRTEAIKDYQEQLTQLKVDVARLSQEQLHVQENINRVEKESLEMVARKKQVQEELAQLSMGYEEYDEDKKHWDEAIQQHTKEKADLEARLSTFRAKRGDLLQLRQTQEINIQSGRQALRKQETQLHQQEVHKNRLDVELDHLLQKLSQEYEMSFERAKERYGNEEAEGAELRVATIKGRLSELGDVNLSAIEEQQRLSERVGFLHAQQEDLLEAKEALYRMIYEMEGEMGKRFLATFESIRTQFQQVFRQMFGGGSADLVLSDPDDLLTSGIEIVAQPPGKKLQNLTLLSGGERVLTALVLLFAIVKVRPVPFCILDEVDAALDEANLVRFSEYLKAFSDKTQFILITHRKRTMEAADVLYGMTMQESGVSTVVSVKLEGLDAQKEAAAGLQEV